MSGDKGKGSRGVPVRPRADGLRPSASFVVPVFDEEAGLEAFYERCRDVATGLFDRWEIVFVDDGSRDGSGDVLRALNARDPRVHVVRLARNFGSHTAIAAGLDHATGDVAVVLAADLQDPPELIGDLLASWREGYDVVWAVREGRAESLPRRIVARTFYALIRKLALPTYPKTGTGSFCLIDKRVVEAVRMFPERNRVTFGIVSWTGFPQAQVPYERPPRQTGSSHWSLGMMIKAAVDTLVSFSYAPIRFVSVVGLIAAAIGFLAAVYLVVASLAFGAAVVGWPSLIVSVLLFGGLNLLILGILGEYIWRVAEEVKQRPLYIVSERIGIGGTETSGPATDGR